MVNIAARKIVSVGRAADKFNDVVKPSQLFASANKLEPRLSSTTTVTAGWVCLSYIPLSQFGTLTGEPLRIDFMTNVIVKHFVHCVEYINMTQAF